MKKQREKLDQKQSTLFNKIDSTINMQEEFIQESAQNFDKKK